MTTPVRYRSSEEDSSRWLAFPLRRGDIVISTRSKSGTTWMQMICALLVFQTADLPAPLAQLSPWLDWLTAPQRQVCDRLAAQQHRRFIKTHTPLDGIPIEPDVSYIVVARHPLDMAVSLYHQSDNIDRERVRQLTGEPQSSIAPPARPDLHSWLVRWTERDCDPQEALDSLPGVLWHLTDAWRRRREPNVLLVHYDDLLADLEGQMRRIAAWLGIDVPAERWATLVEAATFAAMRERAQVLVPDALGVLKDHQAFFRKGRSGAGQALLSTEELSRYHRRVAEMAPADLLAWLHRGR
ncbi:sulfotransferase domain-containing protein [Micromonospora sagamiensis]|uniref:Sulfotransferase domain-containing protein n=1 Tax=Micromonospora sagamiensis TaxID=47875 RepID=A0A562WCW6_9ACTN|nr:sulfotransferase domain-containing protein [Micromonospora sagamiensis]TWJ27975.1 sulfotransferase domain-containing protein [Micromonospora sagamiensis]